MIVATPTPPPAWQFEPTLEVRSRFESRNNLDFNDQKSDLRSDWFNRFRPGLKAKLGKTWSFAIQGQYIHNLAWTSAKNFSSDEMDLFTAFASYDGPEWDLRIGRQRLAIGEQTLLGSADWGNRGTSQDAFWIAHGRAQLMGGQVGIMNNRPQNARFGVLTYQTEAGLSQLHVKTSRNSAGNTEIFTLVQTSNWKQGPWIVDLELAGQAGRTDGLRHRAWAGRSRVTYTASPKWRFITEANIASGGRDSNEIRTFDQLFGTNQRMFGMMDVVGWRNMHEFEITTVWQPSKALRVEGQWHRFWLANKRDAWYSGNNNPVSGYIDPTGSSGRTLGDEMTLDATYQLNPRLSFNAGVGLFQPGTFIRNRNSGSSTSRTWLFIGSTYRF